MKFKTFESFVNQVVSFALGDTRLVYWSDKFRSEMIYDCLVEDKPQIKKVVTRGFLSRQEDYSYTQKVGAQVIQSELWVASCWEGMYSKPEYVGLSKQEAIEKMMRERIPKIAEVLNLEFVGYTFENNISEIVFNIKDGVIYG